MALLANLSTEGIRNVEGQKTQFPKKSERNFPLKRWTKNEKELFFRRNCLISTFFCFGSSCYLRIHFVYSVPRGQSDLLQKFFLSTFLLFFSYAAKVRKPPLRKLIACLLHSPVSASFSLSLFFLHCIFARQTYVV